MAETPRRFVLENMLVAGHPMIPGDSGFQYELLQGAQPDEGNAAVQYPGIKARLVLPLPESGKPMVRADRLYDVHYHLLALAALGDYETRHVYFTAGGLLREMGWSEGGRQMQLVRDCVDYLWRTTMEFEGMFSDPLLAGMSSEQVRAFRILIGRGYPKMEERRSGRRNMSYVEYHPTYMASIASNPGVQLDVELLSLIPGTLGKAHYRTLSWLRAIGENRIELGEMFERVGSVRQRMTRSDAIRVFSGAWEEMLRYRYLRSKPVFDKRGPGQYELVLDWGDPVVLPHRADLLFRAVTDAGVHSATGEWMIKENRLKLVRVMQAFKAGALGKPQTTPAALIVGAFKKEDWDVDVEEMERRPQGVQTELLPAESPSGFTVERQGPLVVRSESGAGTVDWDRALDWVALRGRGGGWEELERSVLVPVLAAAGEANPRVVLGIGNMREGFQRAFGKLGWGGTVDALYGAVAYLGSATMPTSYLRRVLENAAERGSSWEPEATVGAGSGGGAAAPAREADDGRGLGDTPPRSAGEFTGIGIDIRQFKLQQLGSWVELLESQPTRANARDAARFVASVEAGKPTDPEIVELLGRIRERADQLIG